MKKEISENELAIWAIDPFEEKTEPHELEIEKLKAWLKQLHLNLQPVYILDVAVSPRASVEQASFINKKLQEANLAMSSYLQKINFQTSLSPQIFINYDNIDVGGVEALLKRSTDARAKMIVVSSRGRWGIDRFVFGSFAESLLLKSKLPIYFLTHKENYSEKSNRVLFATDFSIHSSRTFDLLLPISKTSNLDIILYFGVSISPAIMSADGMILIPDDYYSQQAEEANREAKKWLTRANAKGVELRFVIADLGIQENIARAVIEAATHDSVQFIAMASSSGRIKSTFFGSVARDILRTHDFPTWVCGPAALVDHAVSVDTGPL